MGLAFLTPLFFAGIGLLAAPYLIHQIRRPEREPHRFSSLLFIPNVEKEVIERKRVQHILLMLMRMLALLLLALAFARPYWKAQGAVLGENGPTQHVILLDTSYSMGHGDVFEKARAEALGVLSSIGESEPFALVLFGSNSDVVVPIRDTDGRTASNREIARATINQATVTADHTDYRLALESAYRHLTTGAAIDPTTQPRVVFHVITDFMKNGLPVKASGWKLPAYVEVETIAVGDQDIENFGVTDIGVRKYPNGDLRVLVKVQNWTDEKRENIEVKLDLNGTEIAENLLTIQSGSTRQSSFRITQEQMAGGGETLTGQVRLVDASMQTDNTRYFTWSMPRKQRILLVGLDREEMRWPPVRLVEQALPNRNELPWLRETIEVGDLVEALSQDGLAASLVILSDYESLNGEVLTMLRDYVQGGGQVLVCASATEGLSGFDVAVFGDLGVTGADAKYEKPRVSRYTMMSWVNLEHPLFIPFQGHKFNDFSSLRFFNYVPITVDEDAEGVNVLARFEDEEPAMVEARLGDGRFIIWAFSPQLSWTNMPKTSRFVPLLHETVMYMTDSTGEGGDWSVGDATDGAQLAWNTADTTIILEPNAESERTISRGEFTEFGTLDVPGFFKSKALAESDWEVVRAINVEGREGDDTPVSEAEFLLKLATAPMLAEEATAGGVVGTEVDEEGFVIETEYGRGLLAALLLLVLIELFYMSVLSTREGVSKPAGSA
jgi:hypothetical protein